MKRKICMPMGDGEGNLIVAIKQARLIHFLLLLNNLGLSVPEKYKQWHITPWD